MMEKSPTVVRYTKEALRAVRFMNEPQAADYLGAKGDALRFNDKEDSRGQGMKQFLDDKTYRPGPRPLPAPEGQGVSDCCKRAALPAPLAAEGRDRAESRPSAAGRFGRRSAPQAGVVGSVTPRH